MSNLTLTRDEHAKVEFAANQWSERFYLPIPADCPPSIRTRIIAERCRRLGAKDIETALSAPVTDRPSPVTRSAAPSPTPVSDPEMDRLAHDAGLIARL